VKARHVCAVLGVAIAVGAFVFVQSLTATNDAQAVRRAEQLLGSVPVEAGAKTAALQLDFRPDGHVLQGPPMMATLATKSGLKDALVTKALFAQRRVKNLPPVGSELTLVGRKGAYRVKLGGYLEWERPVRGYPNVFVSPETAATIGEDWQAYEARTVEELAPRFRSDAGRNLDRAKPLLMWAAALTALCLLLNSLLLSVEARRKEIATLRVLGLTRLGVFGWVFGEAAVLSAVGWLVGVVGAWTVLWGYVRLEAATFPLGMAVSGKGPGLTLAVVPVVCCLGVLLALKKALGVRPLEAASAQVARHRHLGMLISFAVGFGAFVAVEVWGTSLTKPFIPSKEWPDAIVSILPGGVSSFDINKLQKLEGVRKIAELQPLQVNLEPLEELKGPAEREGGMPKGGKGPGGRGPVKAYRNALLLASDWLPDFTFVAGTRTEAERELFGGDACVITEMMARARKLKLGDDLKLDAGRGLKLPLKIVGIVDLNWHMVTSRGLVRGMNRMPVNTDGPVFVSFDTLAACDPRPQEFVHMTHLWLDYTPEFLAQHGVFEAGRRVEREIVKALNGANLETKDGEVRGNTVRLHARDEIADGTLAHGAQLVGAMARVPFIFLAVISLGFVAMLVASADARRREFRVLRAVGATRLQLAAILAGEALKTALWGVAFGLPGGALVGWLATSGTRAAMANWGLPPSFALPVSTILLGALGALGFALLVAVPTAVRLTSGKRGNVV